MLCPRCSLKLPRNTLACARCGELTPRPTGLALDTRPPRQGPRLVPLLGRDLPIDRRQRGVRAVGLPPLRVRPSAPLWARGEDRDPPRRHLQAVPSPDLPVDGAAALRPASILHQARTEPDWHQLPADDLDPLSELLEVDDLDLLEVLPAPLGARAGAAVVDLGVVLAAVLLAALAAVFAFGPDRVLPFLDRGLDYVVDGLLVGQGLGFFVLGLAVVVGFTYVTLAHALLGATFGKRLFGLRIVNRDGLSPSLGESFFRALAAAVSLLPAGLGYALALFDARRLTLHDRLVGTRVVRD